MVGKMNLVKNEKMNEMKENRRNKVNGNKRRNQNETIKILYIEYETYVR